MNISALKPLIENRLAAMLGRQVTFGDLSLSILSGTVDARNLAVADDPQFSPDPFITATVVHIGVQMQPLIFNQEIVIESLDVEAPEIHLVRSANGAWNFSTLYRKDAANPPQAQKQLNIPAFTLNSLRIKGGHATLVNLGSTSAPLRIDEIDLAVDHFAFAKEFPLSLSMVLPGQATLNMTGKAGPINPHDLANTNFGITLAGDKLPGDGLQSLLSAIGLKLPNGAVLQGGSLTTHLTIAGPLRDLIINGPVEFANIRLSGLTMN